MNKAHRLMSILRFALSKRYTNVIGNLIVASDGQTFDINTCEIGVGKPIPLDVDELINNHNNLDLNYVITLLYKGDGKLITLLAFATAINHNLENMNVYVTDISRYVDVNKMATDTHRYLSKLLHQLTYHLSITKYRTINSMDSMDGMEWVCKPVVTKTRKIDVMDINPFEGLTIELNRLRLTVSVVSHGEDIAIIDMLLHNNTNMTVTTWNLHYGADHSIGKLIKGELEKLGLLDLYLQRPLLRNKSNSI